MTGLRSREPPLRVETDAATFYVGPNAHDWGDQVESVALEGLTGSRDMLAIFLGAMTRYGVPDDPVSLIVGLPISSLIGEHAELISTRFLTINPGVGIMVTKNVRSNRY